MSNETLLAISWHSGVVSLKGVTLVCSKAVLVENSTVGTPAPSDVEVAVVFTSPLTSVPLKLCSCHSCSFLLRVCRGRKAAQPAPNTIYPDTSADSRHCNFISCHYVENKRNCNFCLCMLLTVNLSPDVAPPSARVPSKAKRLSTHS